MRHQAQRQEDPELPWERPKLRCVLIRLAEGISPNYLYSRAGDLPAKFKALMCDLIDVPSEFEYPEEELLPIRGMLSAENINNPNSPTARISKGNASAASSNADSPRLLPLVPYPSSCPMFASTSPRAIRIRLK